jgi:DNA-binding transcriptional MerR regulator
MSRANDRTQVMGILHAVQNHVQPAGRAGIREGRIALGRSERDHALVLRSSAGAIQMLARFETHRNAALAAQLDQLLKPSSAGALGDQYTVQRTPGPERLPDGMDSHERRHYDKGTLMSASESVPVQPSHEIPDKLYFRIGEVARLAGIKPYVLRFWETEFSALGPRKSGTGHRLYRRKDVELVLEIKRLLYEKRFTIEGARKFLETRNKPETPRPAKTAKSAAQPGLFPSESSTLLDTVRKELRELAEMLK